MFHNASQLDLDRLRKVWALTNSTNKNEAAAAKQAARRMLAKVGKTLQDAPALLSGASPVHNMFGGFDAYMEEKEPGWGARRAAERAQRKRDEAAERAALIARHGSEEAALVPTPMEAVVEAAVEPFRRVEQKRYANGVFPAETLDGWSDAYKMEEMPVTVRAAVEGAIPLPSTITAAAAELAAWDARDREYGLLHDALGDTCLTLAGQARKEIVRRLLETGLRAASLADVLVRQRYVVTTEYSMPEVDRAVLADLEALAGEGADVH